MRRHPSKIYQCSVVILNDLGLDKISPKYVLKISAVSSTGVENENTDLRDD
jgi:hypothetical protein